MSSPFLNGTQQQDELLRRIEIIQNKLVARENLHQRCLADPNDPMRDARQMLHEAEMTELHDELASCKAMLTVLAEVAIPETGHSTLRAPPVHSLPFELLLEVFLLHVSGNQGSTHVLTNVCHKWREIAWECANLWTNIVLTSPDSSPYRVSLRPSDGYSNVTCQTTAMLQRALRSSGRLPLSITIIITRRDLLEQLLRLAPEIAGRCWQLRLFSCPFLDLDRNQEAVKAISKGVRCFEIRRDWELVVFAGELLQAIEGTLESFFTDNIYTINLLRLVRPLATNLKKLQVLGLSNQGQEFLTSELDLFPSLEELELGGQSTRSTTWLTSLLNLHRLTLSNRELTFLRPHNFPQLTHLIIKDPIVPFNLGTHVVFPTLVFLQFTSQHWHALSWFRAPILVTLELFGGLEDKSAVINDLAIVWPSQAQNCLNPEIFRVNLSVGGDVIVKPLQQMTNLVELEIRFYNVAFSAMLLRAISGSSKSGVTVCPRLQRMTFRNVLENGNIAKGLKGAVEKRRNAGITSLRCSWAGTETYHEYCI